MENVSPTLTWNLTGVCSDIDCRWQVSCSILREFSTPNSNAIIWKTKTFFSIFCSIDGIYFKFETFWTKKMISIANVFPKLHTVKILVRAFSKKRCFRKRFDSQHVKGSKILEKSPSEQFYHVFTWFWGKLIWKISPLVLGEILGVFVDILSANCKYPVQYWGNLPFLIDMQFSEKWKAFSHFFLPFLESSSNFKYFEKKEMMVIANVFRKLQSVKNFIKPLCKQHRFGTRFDRQHVKMSQILAKSPWERFYHVFSSFREKLIWKMSPVLLGEIFGTFLNKVTAEGKYVIEDCNSQFKW